ncbi:MAG: hypothetical protein LBL67_03210 [Coriobacteriales bacterium]|jgi:hypothetical protein|nr:hypothetical protein [Coriobacteriales bacterium]
MAVSKKNDETSARFRLRDLFLLLGACLSYLTQDLREIIKLVTYLIVWLIVIF